MKIVKPVPVVDAADLTITEYFGNVASGTPALSACVAEVRRACAEAFQAPEFDEFVLVLEGEVDLQVSSGEITTVKAGEGVLLPRGLRVKWMWRGPCKYVPICTPAFSPTNCHREHEESAAKDAETMKRLHALHEKSGATATAASSVSVRYELTLGFPAGLLLGTLLSAGLLLGRNALRARRP